MKTPREILLAQHHAAEPKLDTLRRTVIAEELGNTAAREQSRSSVPWFLRGANTLWRELILPSRRIWTGLAAAWLLLVVVNLSQRDTVSSVTGQPVHSPAVTMSWQVQERLVNELLADRLVPPDADQPRTVTPRPRTENCGITTV